MSSVYIITTNQILLEQKFLRSINLNQDYLVFPDVNQVRRININKVDKDIIKIIYTPNSTIKQ